MKEGKKIKPAYSCGLSFNSSHKFSYQVLQGIYFLAEALICILFPTKEILLARN